LGGNLRKCKPPALSKRSPPDKLIMIYEIVDFNPQYAEGLRQCFSYLQDTEAALEPDRLNSSSALAEQYISYLKSQCQSHNGKIFVALADGSVAGFVAVWRESDANNLITSLHSFAYVSDIAVLPEYQRGGIAKRLMSAAEHFAKTLGVTHCKVGVLAKNTAATKLYDSCDFRPHEVTLIKEL
jgi:ribosomal protein S18 acetylase RimI-like enzyme